MTIKILLFFCCLFFHIVADYNLQGILATFKQKSYWKDKPSLYQYDYIISLILHSIAWTFMIMFPPSIYLLYLGEEFTYSYLILFFINTCIHCVVDDQKANKLTISLVTDQLFHISQICLTFVVMVSNL